MLSLDGYEGRLYGVSAVTGVMAAGAGAASEFLQFRWVDPTAPNTRSIRVLHVSMSAIGDTTAFTAGDALFDMIVARGWTAAGTGGTALTLTGNNAKFRTSQNASLFSLASGGEIRVATTAALTAGTKTLDAQAYSTALGGVLATADATIIAPNTTLFEDGNGRQGRPLVLAHQEGFSVRGTLPATGTWKAAVSIVWAEVSG